MFSAEIRKTGSRACDNIPKWSPTCKASFLVPISLFFINLYLARYDFPASSTHSRVVSTRPATSSSGNLSPRKRKIFTIVLISTPFLFFLLLELVLRVADYGPDLSLFKTEVHNGQTYSIMNPGVKSRYFYHVPFNPTASPDYFQMPKPAGTYRIFCLGGSTTTGYPYWFNGAFSSFLRDRLHAVFPDRKIEVINVGMTATNSYTALDMAQDIVAYQPDLFLDYDGHNEFYGALGVSSNETLGSSRWFTLLYLRLIHVRTFLLLRDGIEWITHLFSSQPQSLSRNATLMEEMARGQTIRYRDSDYEKTLQIFRSNLQDLKDLCIEHSVPLLLGTQVSNLRDRAPFISDPHSEWPATDRQRYDRNTAVADSLLQAGQQNEARTLLFQLLEKDSLSALVHFLLGRSYDASGMFDSARSEYIRARDDDELRFRTSSDFNQAILSLTQRPLVLGIDMERVFMDHSPHGLIGKELITEHLHPNSRGNFLLAKAYAEAMRSRGLLATPEDWSTNDTLSDQALWDERSVTELDEIIAARRTEILTSGWPFVNQYPTVEAVNASDTLATIAERATRGQIDWKLAHELAYNYYVERGDEQQAERELKTIINQIPIDVQSILKLAHLYVQAGRLSDARPLLLRSLDVEKTPLAYRALGDIALRSHQPTEAVTFYEQLSLFPQSAKQRSENGYLLALAYLQANRPQPATRTLERLLQFDPGNTQAVALLNRIRSLSR